MKENADRILDRVVEKAIKSSPLERPSSDFTQMVMAQVTAKSSVTRYQPLISRMGWVIIGAGIMGCVVYLYMASGVDTSLWWATLGFNLDLETGFPKLFSGLKLAEITSYALVACGIMLCAQIPILKYVLDKRQRRLS